MYKMFILKIMQKIIIRLNLTSEKYQNNIEKNIKILYFLKKEI